MSHLTLAGLSEDNRRLLLVSDSGQEFTLEIDARLRAALRGEHARLGQLEIHMESTLRPRDIQARIRAGESPESVAMAAHTTVDKILPYANPVLAERAHVAERAQRSSVRRKSGESGARALGDSIAAQLRPLNVDPGSVEWDACRREDGRWSLTAAFATDKRQGTAEFTFDQPGNFVLLENDDARWLVGEIVKQSPSLADELTQARERRRTPEPEEALPLGEDAIELVTDDEDESTVDLTETAARVRGAAPKSAEPVELAPTPEPFAPDAEPEHAAQEAAEPARRPGRKRGRASVPSWDEIMFGGGKAE